MDIRDEELTNDDPTRIKTRDKDRSNPWVVSLLGGLAGLGADNFSDAFNATYKMASNYAQQRNQIRADRAVNDLRSAIENEIQNDMAVDENGKLKPMRSFQQILDAIGNPNRETNMIYNQATDQLRRIYEPRYKEDYNRNVNRYYANQPMPTDMMGLINQERDRALLTGGDTSRISSAAINAATQDKRLQQQLNYQNRLLELREQQAAGQSRRIAERTNSRSSNNMPKIIDEYTKTMEALQLDPNNTFLQQYKAALEAQVGFSGNNIPQKQTQASILDNLQLYRNKRQEIFRYFKNANDKNSFTQTVKGIFPNKEELERLKRDDPELYNIIESQYKYYYEKR